jgi:adenine-specific DNA-methyltransferase
MHYDKFPTTRYQGSKRKLLPWLHENFQTLEFESALDLFGGTGAVAYLFKTLGKDVIFNDVMPCNLQVGKAILTNRNTTLSQEEVANIFVRLPDIDYPTFIQDTFQDIFYTNTENELLDIAVTNINRESDLDKRAALWWVLFQACLCKRPYNLFHRANLYVRTANVKRSFGNKTTWDRSFEDHCEKFRKQYNKAQFDSGKEMSYFCEKAAEVDAEAELVYLDPPYIPERGSLTRYEDFYHFLNGMVTYDSWSECINHDTKHKALEIEKNPWESKAENLAQFETILTRHRDSILVINYRADGSPSIEALETLLLDLGKDVQIATIPQQYVFSKKATHETLLIGS